MPVLARIALLIVVSLLGACSSPAPQTSIVFTPRSATAVPSDVLFRAIGLVGTPYRWGGNTPAGGFDCSGLIGFVYRDAAGIQLPRTTAQLSTLRAPSIKRGALQPGDLVFFATSGGSNVSHAGIYVGEGRFVHAPSSGGTVRLDSLSSRYWQNTYQGAKRIFDEGQVARNR
ncbi:MULTISPECIES: C40 family peptidase [Pseudomonas]|uniref:C40 family peptidase n=1 Tax=Serpens gallinarum TaxID=2763075 RepID=A0ABR8TQT4_9PSED|nr:MULTISPECIES: C40 family peptidase [Pseudomonas]MBD7978123.1 C40 family peptidase [Serpens gallinarum]MBF0675986.1 C40 family peptidase [Pseudomonas sp.]